MSEMRHYTGKLVKLDRVSPTETLEEHAQRIVGGELEDGYDDYLEALQDKFYKQYVVIEDKLYKIKDLDENDPDDSMFKARKINGNDYEFEVRYYDGGCSLDEAIESAVKGEE